MPLDGADAPKLHVVAGDTCDRCQMPKRYKCHTYSHGTLITTACAPTIVGSVMESGLRDSWSAACPEMPLSVYRRVSVCRRLHQNAACAALVKLPHTLSCWPTCQLNFSSVSLKNDLGFFSCIITHLFSSGLIHVSFLNLLSLLSWKRSSADVLALFNSK